jgi:ABC-2 type transport system ATP-binding protein
VPSCSPEALAGTRPGGEKTGVAEHSDPRVVVRSLSVRYAGFRLEPLSFELAPGERLALVGPNGAGKSTLLRSLAGLVPDYDGEIFVCDEELARSVPGARARIGLLPEGLRGYGWMSVAEHLAFVSTFYPTWDRDYCRELLARLALPADAKVGTLSKGMQVKLAFISAESFRPPLLLLDEPTSGLDPVVRREFVNTVRATLDEDPSRIVVFSTHLLEDVQWMAERVMVIDHGRVKADMSLDELAARSPGASVVQALYALLEHADE